MGNFKAYFKIFLIAALAIALIAPPAFAYELPENAEPGWWAKITYSGTYLQSKCKNPPTCEIAEEFSIPFSGQGYSRLTPNDEAIVTILGVKSYSFPLPSGKPGKTQICAFRLRDRFGNKIEGQENDIDVDPANINPYFQNSATPDSAYSLTDYYSISSCEIVKKLPCDVNGFTACVAGKFREKFPFDIFGNLPSSEITCPKITIGIGTESREFDLCWIYEAMRPLKYAIALSLLIKLFIHV